jgi:hypothetical protein
VICHPKLVETGLDLLDFPTIIFYESGYSLHTLRQAGRRSWRIGQRRPVRVKFLPLTLARPAPRSRGATDTDRKNGESLGHFILDSAI